MKSLTIVVVTLVASFALVGSAYAGALNVTGDAKASYQIGSGGNLDTGKALGITNEITFSATGELDNGYTWKYQTELDSGAETTSGAGIDDSQITIGTPYGTVGIYVSEGSLRSAGLGWDTTAFGAGSDNGAGFGIQNGSELSALNSLQYHSPAGLLPLGAVVKVGRSVGDATINSYKATGAVVTPACTNAVRATVTTTTKAVTTAAIANACTTREMNQYTVSLTPIEGATMIVDYFSKDGATGDNQENEGGNAAIKYASGPFSVGVGYGLEALGINNSIAAGHHTIEDYETKRASVGYAVNDALSLSFSREETSVRYVGNNVGLQSDTVGLDSIQAAYTMGGATMALSYDSADNVNNIQGLDQDEMLFTLALAF